MKEKRRLSHYKTRVALATAAAVFVGTVLLGFGEIGFAQTSTGSGVIAGRVTADHGDVVGFRVRARDTVNRITYTIYTLGGQYRFMQLPASQYEVQVLQDGYKSTVVPVDLKAGDTKTADVQLTAVPLPASDLELVEDYDTLYPNEPGRAVLERECFGCHGPRFFHARRLPLAGWRAMIAKMTEPGGAYDGVPQRGDLSAETKEVIVQYLVKHFGPDSKKRDFRLDKLAVDEKAVAGALFIEYDLPPAPADAPRRGGGPGPARGAGAGPGAGPGPARGAGPGPGAGGMMFGGRALHDPGVAPDGRIWFSDQGGSSVLGLDPKVLSFEKRYESHTVSTDTYGLVHGLAVDQKGNVYWNEIQSGVIGKYDPKTKQGVRYDKGYKGGGHSMAVDSKGDVWNTVVFGSVLSKLDTSEGKVVHWEMPTPYAGSYGIRVDAKDNVWIAGLAKHMIIKFDPATQKFTEYKTPTQPSGPRRLQLDSKGRVWFSEYSSSALGVLDPASGEMKEYKLPLRYTGTYGLGIDKDDNLWISDTTRIVGAQWQMPTYEVIVKFDQKTEKFTYYPLPRDNISIPHMEMDKEGTFWFGSSTAVAFKPKGNVAAR